MGRETGEKRTLLSDYPDKLNPCFRISHEEIHAYGECPRRAASARY
jgi:hypothetical protein